jgi:hypothetical protein
LDVSERIIQATSKGEIRFDFPKDIFLKNPNRRLLPKKLRMFMTPAAPNSARQ